MMFLPALFSSLLSGDPAPLPSPARVYVVYVTVVELDAEGNETVLLTPKVQTTGNPAGVTVQLEDDRQFAFRCEFATPVAGQSGLPKLAKVSRSNGGNETGERPVVSREPARQKVDDYLFRTYDVSELMDGESELTAADFEPLIQTIKTVAAPESWQGKATIRPFVSTRSLVIKQTAAVHQDVAQALKELTPKKSP